MVAFQENIICGRLFIKFPTKFLKIIWGRSKSSFKKTITACVFTRRPSFLMGIFFYACHFEMTNSLSFRNESHRLIFDLWVIYRRQNCRFERIASYPFDMMADSLFEMMMAISSR